MRIAAGAVDAARRDYAVITMKISKIAAPFTAAAAIIAGAVMLTCGPGAPPAAEAPTAGTPLPATAGDLPPPPLPTLAPAPTLALRTPARPPADPARTATATATEPSPSPTTPGPTPPPPTAYHTPPPPTNVPPTIVSPTIAPSDNMPPPPPPPPSSSDLLPTATAAPVPAAPMGTGIGETPPAFTMQLSDGAQVASADLAAAGRPVFMHYFATW